ncbi:uncharacterized protein LOC8031523 isoform X2 [Ixodes scapularis]|uniref:uncharacterized protein LOC8031523 isoform X2 n=1 Tax=Ixodes scapularis TaxID=6945 RepID=UPI001AD64EEA|nr:uncharacterized protein LOC8031523 isoform X2 [Ixodes scapularis]
MASSMDSTVAEKTATKCWELGETRPRWVHMETAGGELMGPHAGRDGSSLQAAGTQAPSRHAQDTGGQIQGDGKVHPHSNGLRDPQGRRVPEGLRRHAGQSRGRLPPLLPVLPQADGSQGGRAHSPGRHHHRHLGCTVLRGLAPVPYSHRPPGHGPQVQAQGGGDCPGGRLLQPQQKARPQAQGECCPRTPSGRLSSGLPQEELKDEEESLLRKIIEEQVDIRGGYSRPSLRQVLWVQLVLLPVTLGHLAWWQARWLFKFTLGGQELGPVEKEYLIRRHMGLSQGQWDALEDRERQGFLRDQLWLKDKFKVWKQRQEEEMRAKLAESARYKSYRRYMKNHGPGQISFED